MDPPPCVQAPAQGQQRTVGKECHKNLIWLFSFAGRTASGVRGGIGGAVPPPTPPCLPDMLYTEWQRQLHNRNSRSSDIGLGWEGVQVHGTAVRRTQGVRGRRRQGKAQRNHSVGHKESVSSGCRHRELLWCPPPPGSSAHRLICPGYAGTSGPILGRVQIPGVCGVGGEGYVFKVD